MPGGWYLEMEYPVEGDTAIASIYYDRLQYATLWLENIDLTATGDGRVARAKVVVEQHPAPRRRVGPGWLVHEDGVPWQVDAGEAARQLERARHRLLENERGREPVTDEGMTPAGAAFAKISRENERRNPREE